MRHRRAIASTVVAAVPIVALAEVMDKLPVVSDLWPWAICMALAGLALGRIHPALGLIAFLYPNPVVSILFELHDPYVGPAIAKEAGQRYIASVYAQNAVWLLAFLTGCLWWWRARKQGTSRTHTKLRTS